MKKILLLVFFFVYKISFGQAPPNDNCITPQVIVIPVSGTICLNSTNINATSDGFTNTCDTGVPGDEVWFAFVATGAQNTVTITPNGGTPAQQVVVSMQNTNCASGTYNICNASATAGGVATVTYAYTPGTQILFSVETNGADGTFQVCVTSTTPPPGPGSSCATTTAICNESPFTLNPMPSYVTPLLPSCFFVNLQQPVFYEFTVGVSGTCAWTGTPLGAAEYDWAMYNITAGCPGFEVACNYDYAFSVGAPFGMSTASGTACPISTASGLVSDEFCPSIVVTAGQTYLIVIDNFDFNGIGFNLTWGNGTFQMPSSSFTVNPTNSCNSAVATVVNTSVPASAASLWNFGDGTTSTLHSPPPHNYPAPGTYLISLTTTAINGCQYISTNSVTVNATPTMTPPPNITVCAGTVVPISNFVSNPTGATFAWTNSNVAIGLGANGAGNTPAFTATNATVANIVSTITVTPTRNACPGLPVNYTITVKPASTVSNAGPPQNVCGTIASLAGNAPAVGIGTWTLVSGTGTITTPNSPTSGLTGLGLGVNVFQWTIVNPPCPPSSSQVTITVVNATTVSVAGPNQTVCGPIATLAGNVATFSLGTWTLVSGAGTITTPNSPSSGLTALGPGANVFQWTITNGGCPSTSSQVTITSVPVPTVSVAGINQTVCGTSATLGGNPAVTGVGAWTLVSGTGTITSSTLFNSGVTALGPGANVFQWTISNGVCPPSSSQTTITSVLAPSVSVAGANQTVCGTNATLTGNLPLSGTGLWTVVSGGGTITNAALNSSGITALGVGANVFQWTISNAPCPPSSNQVTITGVSAPTPAVFVLPQTYCGTNATLAGNSPLVGVGTWTLFSGAGTITNPNNPTSTITGLGVGTNVFQWTITNAPCPSSSMQSTIIGVAPPTLATAGTNQIVCGNTATLAGNSATTGNGLWTLVSGAGTITTPTSESSGLTALGPGANVFQWTISNAPCPATSAQVTITSVAAPSVSVAGANQTVCGTAATLGGNIPATGTGLWTLISGAGTITTPASESSGLTALGTGANVFQWTISNFPCPSSSSQVTITGVPVPTTALAGPNQIVCATTATLAGNTAATGTGLWTLVSGTGTITTPTSESSGITGIGIGANVFQWTISNAPCPATSSQVNITGNNPSTIATAGTNQMVCGTTATLAGNAPAAGTGTWTLISGTGSITNPSQANSGVTGLGFGANVFQWEIDDLPCAPTTAQVTITAVDVPTVSVSGPNQNICGTTATLAANMATTGTGLWTLISGNGTVTNPSFESSGITGLTAGANVFQWTILNAPCPSSSSQVTITVGAVPTVANAGTNQTVCGTVATLAGNVATSGVGTWTLISGAGTITNPALENSSLTGLGAGANVFQWQIDLLPCTATTSQVTITSVAAPSIASAGPNQNVCGSTATLSGNIATVGTGLWTLISGSGTITTPTSESSGITGLGAGANVFQWTISNPPCPASTSQVTITGVTIPTVAVAGPNQTVCGTNATLAGNTATIGTGLWTVISGSGTFTNSASGTSAVTALGAGANAFQWTISNGICPSTSSQVTITGVATPTVSSAGPNQTICATTTTLAGNTATTGSGLWTLVSGGGTITNPALATSGVTGLATGTDVFQWTITNAPCPATTSQVTITVGAPTTVANAGTNQTVCGTNATLAGNIAVVGTGAWTLVSGNGNINSPASPNSNVTLLGTGANVFQWTITSANCPPSTSQVTITSNPIPLPPFVVSPVIYCQNDLAFSLSANGSNLLWYTAATGGIGSPVPPVPSTTSSGTTDYYVSQTVNGCEGPRAIIAVIINALPIASFYAPLTNSIENPVINFTDESVSATSWLWNFGNFSTPLANTSSLRNPTHTYSAVGTYCISLVVANGICIDSTTLCLVINPLFTFYVPNAFSPNNDGINDEFFGKGENIKQFEMTIYDRWGNLLFYGDDISKHWQGNVIGGTGIAQEDVYVYVINIKDNLNQYHKYIGSLSLVK